MLSLPIPLKTVRAEIIPTAMSLMPARLASRRGELLLLAIGLQESDFGDRRQGPVSRPGPARGLWQFEVPGVQQAMTSAATEQIARNVCAARGAAWQARSIHNQLEFDDILACAFARLLLWSDPRPLPPEGDLEGAFDCYLRNWRPGAAKTPHGYRECLARWRRNYPKAIEAMAA